MLTRISLQAHLLAVTLFFSAHIAAPFSSSCRAVEKEADWASGIEGKPAFGEPCLSPDRSEIAFVSGSEIWTVPAAGGEARLLVSHPATESRPLYSPDGKRLAFTSTRTGNGDIYVLTFASSELKRITFEGGAHLENWSRDGKWLYYSSSSRDISLMSDIFRVSSEGGTPMPVSDERYVSEFFAAPSPDGSTLAFCGHGTSKSYWWRKGHSHYEEGEIWLRREGATPAYERFTETGAKDMWPMWNAKGDAIYFVSDRSGAENIWLKPLTGPAKAVTEFKDGRVLWPSISYDGAAIVFERNFGIWMLDIATGQTKELPISLRGAISVSPIEHKSFTSGFYEYVVSPDGKKVAFVVHGKVFATSARDGGEAVRLNPNSAMEQDVVWAPDSKKLVYCSARAGSTHLFLHDFSNSSETQLTRDPQGDAQPVFSPDGKLLAFERGGSEIRVLELATQKERVVATCEFDRPPMNAKRAYAWSPDSAWLAYAAPSNKGFVNLNVVPAEGGASRQVSFLANLSGDSISWSPDGTFLLFRTGYPEELYRLARVDLIERAPKFREDPIHELFPDEPAHAARVPAPIPAPAPATGITTGSTPPRPQPETATTVVKIEPKKVPIKRTEITFENIRQRLHMLPDSGIASPVISPDGKTVVIILNSGGSDNLYTYSLDEYSRDVVARQLTSTTGGKSHAQFSPDGKEVYYLDQGRISVVPLDTRVPRTLSITAEMDVDFAREKLEVFKQAWTYLRDNFFDEHFNGVDWQAMRELYAPRIAGARTSDEARRLMLMMMGELNASHMGIHAAAVYSTQMAGCLGLRFDRAEYESAGRLHVTEVVALGPAAAAGIKTGAYLLAVDGTAITPRTNLDELLSYKIGRRTALTIASNADGANKREIAVRPVDVAAEKQLLYRQWVEDRRAYVAKISNGRLGYVHMFDMKQAALTQLYVDLDAENQSREGVVVDVRNNNGGSVNDFAIDVLSRRSHYWWAKRGHPTFPARQQRGQRVLEVPTVLLCNQHSVSDAENFVEGYRSLKLGKVVGEPSAGWLVGTNEATLLDGSKLRLPHVRITTAKNEPMEMIPRPVDIDVRRPFGEGAAGRDSQLDAAVKELLGQMGR